MLPIWEAQVGAWFFGDVGGVEADDDFVCGIVRRLLQRRTGESVLTSLGMGFII